MVWKRIVVNETERALVFERGRLIDILGPGVYRLWSLNRGLEVEVHPILVPFLDSPHVESLVLSDSLLVDEQFLRIRAGESQVIALYVDGVLKRVFGPGEYGLAWKGKRNIERMHFPISGDPQIDQKIIPSILRYGAANARAQTVTVADQTVGLIYVNGTFLRCVGPGLHAFWTVLGPVQVQHVDLRRQTLEVNGQEILTKDKVTLRVNVVADYQIMDPMLAVSTVRSVTDSLYRLLQLAVRRSLGTRTLDEVLQEKVEIDPASVESIREQMREFGVAVGGMALKDIVLPGEIREICNQVVAAEKQAQANLIRRREETAATRSLLNTARLMDESPILLRLKELETLEKLTEKVGSVTVTGGFEGMLDKLLVPMKK